MKPFYLIFSPHGQITRLDFLLGHIFIVLLASIPLYLIPIMLSGFFDPNPQQYAFSSASGLLKIVIVLIYMVGLVGMLYSSLCLGIKRFRNAGFSSWCSLLLLIPYLGLLVFLFLVFYPSQDK